MNGANRKRACRAENAYPPRIGSVISAPPPHMEELWVCMILMQTSLCFMDEYNAYLDALFLQDEANDFLLELEWCTRDVRRSIYLIDEYFKSTPTDDHILAAALIRRLRGIYLSGSPDIHEFARLTYRGWSILPQALREHESLSILAYADEVLEDGDAKKAEKKARVLYEKALLLPDDATQAESEDARKKTSCFLHIIRPLFVYRHRKGK